MKKIVLVLFLVLLLNNVIALAEIPDSSALYYTDSISFSLANVYLHTAPVNNFIILEFNWKNMTSNPLSFNLNLLVTGFQNGKELSRIKYEPDYDTDLMNVNSLTEIMPGNENIDYEFIPIKDDSEVTVNIDNAFETGNNFNNISFTVLPSELPEFQWPNEN